MTKEKTSETVGEVGGGGWREARVMSHCIFDVSTSPYDCPLKWFFIYSYMNTRKSCIFGVPLSVLIFGSVLSYRLIGFG